MPRCLFCDAPCDAPYCSQGCAEADQLDPVIAREERREAFLRWVDEGAAHAEP